MIGYRAVVRAEALGPTVAEFFDDFHDSQATPLQWTPFVVGGAFQNGVVHSDAVGLVLLSTGLTATGGYALQRGTGLLFGVAELQLDFRAGLYDLSTAADEYSVVIGFSDNLVGTGIDATDGAYFRYQRTVDGNFWACITRNNGVETKTVTTVAPSTGGGLQHFRILAPEDATQVWYFIDGEPVAHHDVTLPTDPARWFGYGVQILKSAGLNNRLMGLDYCYLRSAREVDRGL